MSGERVGDADRRGERMLLAAGYFFAIGSTVHVFDHLQRGQGSVTEHLSWAGSLALVIQVVIIALVLTSHPAASTAAAVGGFGLALGFAAAHWLPTWSPFSDSFVDNTAPAFSYIASGMEIFGALAIGLAGLAIVRSRGTVATAHRRDPVRRGRAQRR